ncbi:MAG: glutamine synthetase, partial [Chloroflexi bacterium]
MSTLTRQDILSTIKSENVRFIDLWFTDIIGIVKSVTIPATEIENVLDNGSHFDGSSIEGFARVAESDMVLWPDLNTFAILPWTPADERVARLICTVYTPTGEPFIGDPRTALIRNLQQAEAEGYAFKTGMELEFFLFPRDAQGKPIIRPPVDDYAAYFDMVPEQIQSIRRKMLATLAEMGIRADSVHSEIGYGQHEIDFQYSDALDTADNILTARIVIRTIARQYGLHCTFMPRPSNEFPGSGMHTHQSLHDPTTGENVFVDTSDEYNLSATARRFLAGQLAHARAMCAILAPLV